MLNEQTKTTLKNLKLYGMSKSYEEQCEQIEAQALSFDERLGLMIDRESTERKNRRLSILMRSAKLRQSACVEDIDYRHPRGLERAFMANLMTCDFISRYKNVLITGPTGCGKSWLACALGQQACRQGLSVRYQRTSQLLEDLRIAHANGSYGKLASAIAKIDLLILDDFGLNPLNQPERRDLFEIIEDRHNRKSTLITAQLPIKNWHEYLNDPSVADAILDRLLSSAHRLELHGKSMRVARGID